jgi:lactate dehydrogenase-like 2-hydroxyacid dehydrogenase
MNLPADARARIEAVGDCIDVRPDPAGTWLAAIREADALICSNLVSIGQGELDALPNLRVLSGYGVGFDRFDVAAANERHVAVCNTPGVLSDAVADLTMGLILAASRGIVSGARYVLEGEWQPGAALPPLGFDVSGKTLGIVGFGRIGRATARRAQAFGMQVCFFDLVREVEGDLAACTYYDLDDLLASSDILSLHVDLNERTHHLIGARELALMKPTAWLVNTARGGIVDQAALTDALRDGTIAGAALDVLETEPPDPADPLLQLPNAIILPHVGSATIETRRAMLDLAVDNLIAVVSGARPRACVNPAVLPSS